MKPSRVNEVGKALIAGLFTAGILLGTAHAQRQMAPTVAEQYLLAAANQERAARGIAPLHLDRTLAQAAAFHAREMAANSGISHQFPGEPALATRGANAGARFSLITENVAEAPSSPIIHDLWMHSPGHRANLLDPNVDSVGIAIVSRDNQLYAVEDFARTVETLSLNEQEREVANVIAHESGIAISDSTPAARQTCEMSTGYAGSRKPWFVMRYTAASLDEIPSELKSRLSSGKYHQAVIGACAPETKPFTAYNIAVLLYP